MKKDDTIDLDQAKRLRDERLRQEIFFEVTSAGYKYACYSLHRELTHPYGYDDEFMRQMFESILSLNRTLKEMEKNGGKEARHARE